MANYKMKGSSFYGKKISYGKKGVKSPLQQSTMEGDPVGRTKEEFEGVKLESKGRTQKGARRGLKRGTWPERPTASGQVELERSKDLKDLKELQKILVLREWKNTMKVASKSKEI